MSHSFTNRLKIPLNFRSLSAEISLIYQQEEYWCCEKEKKWKIWAAFLKGHFLVLMWFSWFKKENQNNFIMLVYCINGAYIFWTLDFQTCLAIKLHFIILGKTERRMKGLSKNEIVPGMCSLILLWILK